MTAGMSASAKEMLLWSDQKVKEMGLSGPVFYNDTDEVYFTLARAPHKIVIIGAGPTGLGAAWRLYERQQQSIDDKTTIPFQWTLIDSALKPAGLAASIVDPQGFTWDLGGHVIFSHYEYFTKLLDGLIKDWNHREREAWVWMRDRFVPYPLQNNIGRLPKEDIDKSVAGLVEIIEKKTTGVSAPKPANFHEWLEQSFGKGLMEVFMTPYNEKVWAYPAKEMNVEWMGERVATVDLKKIRANIAEGKDDIGWGPNATFRFPKKGGTGSIWTSLFNKLPAKNTQLGRTIVSVDAQAKTVTSAGGTVYPYDSLITTMPLDVLCRALKGLDGFSAERLEEIAKSLKYSSTHVVGFGLEGQPPEHLKTKCWIYFPEDNCPFYRATVFSNYSKHNVAKPGQQWSIMCEISESNAKPVDEKTIVQLAETGCLNTKMFTSEAKIVSRFHVRLEHGYPTPFLGRDELCKALFEALHNHNIFPRGRFGAWKYEVSNQDHSLMQGVEAADHCLHKNSPEPTFYTPSVVNGKPQTDRKLLVLPNVVPLPLQQVVPIFRTRINITELRHLLGQS